VGYISSVSSSKAHMFAMFSVLAATLAGCAGAAIEGRHPMSESFCPASESQCSGTPMRLLRCVARSSSVRMSVAMDACRLVRPFVISRSREDCAVVPIADTRVPRYYVFDLALTSTGILEAVECGSSTVVEGRQSGARLIEATRVWDCEFVSWRDARDDEFALLGCDAAVVHYDPSLSEGVDWVGGL